MPPSTHQEPPPRDGRIPARELVLAGIMAALPLVAGRFLPLIDAPQHLAMARILGALLRGDSAFTTDYEIDVWPVPYWLYYLLTVGLSSCVSLEHANKLVLFLYTISLGLGVRAVLRAYGRDPRWWLVAVPLAWTNCYVYAFMAYLVGIPVVLFGIAAAERAFARQDGGASARWALGNLAVLAYFAHAQAYLWLMLSVALLALLHRTPWRHRMRTLLTVVPSAILFLAWVARTFRGEAPTPDNSTYGSLANLGMVWEPMLARWTTAPEDLFGGCTDRSNWGLGIAWLALVAAAFVRPAFAGRPCSLAARPPMFVNPRPTVLFLAFLAVWAVLPYSVRGQWYLAPRYLVFVATMMLVVAAGNTQVHDLLRKTGVILAVLLSANTARVAREFQPAMSGLEELLGQIPAGDKVAHFPFDERNTYDAAGKAVDGVVTVVDMPTSVRAFGHIPEYAGSPSAWMSPTHHASAYYLVWKSGVVGISFAASPTNPVRFRPGKKPVSLVEYEFEKVDLAAATREFGWFLVRGPLQGTARALPEYADRHAVAGTWELWRSRAAPAGR